MKLEEYFDSFNDQELHSGKMTLSDFRRVTAHLPGELVMIVNCPEAEEARSVVQVDTHWHGALTLMHE